MTITVSLPDLAPKAQVPPDCPVCNAPLCSSWPLGEPTFECGSAYVLRGWLRALSGCPSASPAAVVAAMLARGDKPSDIIDAVLAGLTPEQRAEIALVFAEDHSSERGTGDCLVAAADALREAGA